MNRITYRVNLFCLSILSLFSSDFTVFIDSEVCFDTFFFWLGLFDILLAFLTMPVSAYCVGHEFRSDIVSSVLPFTVCVMSSQPSVPFLYFCDIEFFSIFFLSFWSDQCFILFPLSLQLLDGLLFRKQYMRDSLFFLTDQQTLIR